MKKSTDSAIKRRNFVKILMKLLLISSLCLTLIGCTKDESNILGEKSKYEVSDFLVSLRVKEGSLTKSKATLILENHTDNDYLYGNPFSIEKEENGNWYKLKPINELSFDLIAYILKAKDSLEIELDWKYGYGELSAGKYRIIKDVFINTEEPIGEEDMVYIAAEFVIE